MLALERRVLFMEAKAMLKDFVLAVILTALAVTTGVLAADLETTKVNCSNTKNGSSVVVIASDAQTGAVLETMKLHKGDHIDHRLWRDSKVRLATQCEQMLRDVVPKSQIDRVLSVISHH